MGAYAEAYRRALDDPEGFWGEAADAIDWDRRWDRVLDQSNAPFTRWFAGGRLNTCHNALDRHVAAGHGDRLALIHDSPVTGTVRRFTYAEMTDRVARFAGAMRALGVGAGDRVVIYMPMVPEAAIAMLACARLGAVHSVVFGGFAAPELAARIDDCEPKLVVSASCGIEVARVIAYKPLLDAALGLARHKVAAAVVLQRPQCEAAMTAGRDHDWAELEAAAEPAGCVPVAATDPLYILYTSGTTGQPKGIVRDNGGHAVALAWSIPAIYGLRPGEVMWTASDVGWVVGHSYIVYGPLLAGCTSVMYEGKPVGTPDAGAYWRVVEQHGVSVLFTAPTAFRAIKREDPEGRLLAGRDLSAFRALFLAGERCDPDTLGWAEKLLRVPVIDHWWQTETGWPICANPLGLEPMPVKPGSPTRPMPGWDVRVLGPDGHEMPRGEIGALACRLPMPPGAAPTLWRADARFRSAYLEDHPGFYKTGDAGVARPHQTIAAEAVRRVRDGIGPVAAFKTAMIVDRLPKTRSGKILRGTMARIADSVPFAVPATIDDPAILDEIRATLRRSGYGSG
jgi:propionyl-CoA synthetase